MCSSLTVVHGPAEIQKAALHKETQYWYRDDSITAGQASQIVKQRLSNLGPQSMLPVDPQLFIDYALPRNQVNTCQEAQQ